MDFSILIGNFIIPTVTHSIIFQRGRAQPPTRLLKHVSSHSPQRILNGEVPGPALGPLRGNGCGRHERI